MKWIVVQAYSWRKYIEYRGNLECRGLRDGGTLDINMISENE